MKLKVFFKKHKQIAIENGSDILFAISAFLILICRFGKFNNIYYTLALIILIILLMLVGYFLTKKNEKRNENELL